jgi:hypothetical protein
MSGAIRSSDSAERAAVSPLQHANEISLGQTGDAPFALAPGVEPQQMTGSADTVPSLPFANNPVLSAGSSIVGWVNAPRDSDWYAVNLVAGVR